MPWLWSRQTLVAVVLLPNNKNIVPTAEQVGELVEAEVFVVPTTSIAGGLATMVGFDAVGEPEEVFEEMGEIAASLRLGEVTQAVRDARVDGREVPEGAYIGLLDGKLHVVEESVEAAALKLAESIVKEGADVLTLLCGAELAEESARRIEEQVRGLDGKLGGRGPRGRPADVPDPDGGRMTTAIVTDSTTSLSPEILERPDVRMVPLSFHFGADETYTDKTDLTDAEFYEKLHQADEFPTTSQPPAGAFVEAYESLSAYDDILVLTISRELSGTYDSAVAAADMVDARVEVLDTRSAEMGAGLILLEALQTIDNGGRLRRRAPGRGTGDGER